jgi:hypothetical protein
MRCNALDPHPPARSFPQSSVLADMFVITAVTVLLSAATVELSEKVAAWTERSPVRASPGRAGSAV